MLFYYHYNLIHFYRLKKALPRHGNIPAMSMNYTMYINKLCTRTLYDGSGQPHICIDEYMKRRLQIKLIHSIVSPIGD